MPTMRAEASGPDGQGERVVVGSGVPSVPLVGPRRYSQRYEVKLSALRSDDGQCGYVLRRPAALRGAPHLVHAVPYGPDLVGGLSGMDVLHRGGVSVLC